MAKISNTKLTVSFLVIDEICLKEAQTTFQKCL